MSCCATCEHGLGAAQNDPHSVLYASYHNSPRTGGGSRTQRISLQSPLPCFGELLDQGVCSTECYDFGLVGVVGGGGFGLFCRNKMLSLCVLWISTGAASFMQGHVSVGPCRVNDNARATMALNDC